MAALDRMTPADYPYAHLEGNSDAHIKAVLDRVLGFNSLVWRRFESWHMAGDFFYGI